MGYKEFNYQNVEDLFSKLGVILIPEHILAFFNIWEVQEYKDGWGIKMREKEDLIPKELSECQNIIFDGYCEPLETVSYNFVCKPLYFRLYRRLYKRSNDEKRFCNEYDVIFKEVKWEMDWEYF